MILPNASQMRAIDQCAINHFGIPGIVLMENAGLGTVLKIEQLYGPLPGAPIPIFIGPGNNGGDGLVIARHLLQRHARPLLIFLVEPAKLGGDSAINLAIVDKLDLPTFVCSTAKLFDQAISFIRDHESRLGPARLYIDSIFGTGLCRSIEGRFKDLIEFINADASTRNIPIVAVDTPSGLDSDTGKIFNTCVAADITTTYGYAKCGQMTAGGAAHTGSLYVIDIGIPDQVLRHVPVPVHGIDPALCKPMLKHFERARDTHKGSYGHLLIAGGSAGKTGAAVLAGRGALRSGCGLVSLCCPQDLNPVFESASTEMMSLPLASSSRFGKDDFDPIMKHAEDKDALVLGPGIGTEETTAELVVKLYNDSPLPMVVDADALNIIAKNRDKLKSPPAPRMLTPHPGEMARLLECETAAVQQNRVKAVRQCVERFQAAGTELIVILKGAATVVGDGKLIGVNTTGNPGMAAGGMGDVLSGMLGSLLCQGLAPFDAARFGVFLHGYCGDRLFAASGIGFSATELADDIGSALLALQP